MWTYGQERGPHRIWEARGIQTLSCCLLQEVTGTAFLETGLLMLPAKMRGSKEEPLLGSIPSY